MDGEGIRNEIVKVSAAIVLDVILDAGIALARDGKKHPSLSWCMGQADPPTWDTPAVENDPTSQAIYPF